MGWFALTAPAAAQDPPDTSVEPRSRGRALPRIVDVLLGLLVALAAYRPDHLTVIWGIDSVRFWSVDDSWLLGLYEARRQGLRFGHDLVFTYGPLGVLEHPSFWHTQAGWVVLACQVLGLAAVAVGIARIWARSVHPALAWLLSYVVMVTVNWTLDVFAIAGVALAIDAVGAPERDHRRLWPVVVASAVAGVAGLAKLSLVPVVGAVALGLALLVGGRRRTLVAVALVPSVALASLVVGWLLLGQRFGDLVGYARGSASLLSGYSQAMSLELPRTSGEYRKAAVLLPVVALATWIRVRALPRWTALVVGSVMAVVLAVAFRLGFVRHDQHAAIFFSAVVLALAATRSTPGRPWSSADGPWVRAALMLTAVGVLWPVNAASPETITGGPRRVIGFPGMVRHASDRSVLEDARDLALGSRGLDPSTVDRILEEVRDDTVHVDPVDAFLVPLLDLNWRPAPVFQLYAAYTPVLDELNADAVRERGPQWILRRPGVAVDRHNPLWESPRYQLEVLCRYDVAGVFGVWQLLERLPSDRCGPARELGSAVGPAVAAVEVPEGNGGIVLVEVTCERSVGQRLREIVFKPRAPARVVTAERTYVIQPAHLAGPLVVRSEEQQIESLRVQGCAHPPTYRFYERSV